MTSQQYVGRNAHAAFMIGRGCGAWFVAVRPRDGLEHTVRGTFVLQTQFP